MGNSQSKRLKTAVKGERWEEVNSILSDSNYSSSVVEQFITACEQYGMVCVDGEILSHCSSEQRTRLLLRTAIKEKRWDEVKTLLRDSNYSSSVILEFVLACGAYGVIYVDHEILSRCNKWVRDYLLKISVRQRGWREVTIVLRDSNYDSSVVDQFITACKVYGVIYVDDKILSHCNIEQRDRLLETSVKQSALWEVIFILSSSNYNSSAVDKFITACEKYGKIHVYQEILAHCSKKQLDRLLTLATTKDNWRTVGKVLRSGGSHEKRLWAIEEACTRADYRHFQDYILPYVDGDFLSQYSTEILDTLLTTATTRGLWHMVHKVFKAGGSHEKRVWAIEQACKRADYIHFKCYIFPHVDDDFLSHCSTEQLDTLLKTAKKRQLWITVCKMLKAVVNVSKRVLVIEEMCKKNDYKNFENDILPCVDDDFLSQCTTAQLDTLLTTATIRGLWHMVHKVLNAGGSHETSLWVIERACKRADLKNFEDYILPHVDNDFLSQCTTDQLHTLLSFGFQDMMEGVSAKSCMWAMFEVCKGLTYATVTRIMNIAFGISNVQLLINSMPSNQLSREAQNVALRFALQQRRWDVITPVSLSQVWEQVRRHLFREAVYQRRWAIVKKWADHSLYDDERWWALEEAYKHKEWDVMLQLSKHGLTEIELMRVRYRLAKHADWDVVLRMIRRGVDVTEVREVLESTVISRKTKTTTDRATQQAFALRLRQLCQLEEKLTRASARRLQLPSTARQWNTVLFHLHRHPRTVSVLSRSQPGKTFGGLLLQRAIEKRLWHVVMHLVTLGLDTDQLDSLLTDMMRRRQWGVCRVLLEQGVSIQSCLSALLVFMEKDQWTLVARVIEFIVDDALKRHIEHLALNKNVGSLVWLCVSTMFRYGFCVGDAVRLKVIQRAMERREGSVVGECISTMQHHRLTVKEREELFQQAISRGLLQAVKPLVEEKDRTEIRHRDATMLAAIEQRQWDVVDCCQLQGADINMKNECGQTPLNREMTILDSNEDSNIEWKAVEELLVRGADPNVLDSYGCSVLNIAIAAKQWDIVRLLIECLGDIHKTARYNHWYHDMIERTPLQFLIDYRQGEIIHHTLIWCPDQAKGVNDAGETTLHAIALDKRPELLYYQIVRGVNPLTLTKRGHSVLFYAAQNEHCPQRMVGECIKLGFSTHQPTLSQQTAVGMVKSVTDGLLNEWSVWRSGITSPFLLAVVHGMPVVAHMLYESGSCSYPELLHLYTVLLGLSNPHTEDGRKLLEGAHLEDWMKITFCERYRQRYDAFMNTLTTFLPYLREMATTPRSLVSTCRLVISHCLTVRRRRERDVQDLCLTDRMKNYLMRVPDRIKDFLLFSDLTDPDYQWFVYGTLPPLPPQRGRKGLNRRRRR